MDTSTQSAPADAPRRHRARLGAVAAGVALCLWGLAACGGGGGGGGGAAGSPEPPAPVNLPPVDVSRIAAADPGSTLPADWQRGAFMQIFVRSYQDSDGDGIGDLRGLISRLDYLRDLGVKGLWLMPVNPSQDRDHGYAVTDYRAIEPAYGTLADFDELLRQAHARGIGVIIDYVVNHSAAQHPLFVNSRATGSNPYRDWYLWESSKPGGWNIYGGDPWRSNPNGGGFYFAAFWDQMPDFNLRNPNVVTWHHDNLRFWLNRGVDGFRFDAVGHLVENGSTAWNNQPQNAPLLRDARALMDGYARRFLVCEGPDAPLMYQDACGSSFAFGLHSRMVDAARGNLTAIAAVAQHFTSNPLGMSTLLANHDSFAGDRIFNQLQGDLARYKLAAATNLLLAGTPFIYYGEEIGMSRGSPGGDPGLRTPMSWTGDTRTGGFTTGTPYRVLAGNVASANVAAQQADPNSLLNHYKAMLALRNTLPAIARGSYEAARVSGSVMTFQRRLGDERVLVAINYGTGGDTLAVDGLPAGAALRSRHPVAGGDVVADGSGRAQITLAPLSLRVFLVQ